MAALRQDHRRRGIRVVPMSADKAVRHVDVSDRFIQFNANQTPDGPLIEQVAHLVEEAGVAQDMGYGEDLVILLRFLCDRLALLEGRHHRFFTQDMVLALHGGEDRILVHRILDGDDDRIDRKRSLKERSPIADGEAALDRVLLDDPPSFGLIRFCDRHNGQFIRMVEGVLGIRETASVTGAEQCYADRVHHDPPWILSSSDGDGQESSRLCCTAPALSLYP